MILSLIILPLCAAQDNKLSLDAEIEDSATRQLSINKTALLMGPGEQNRLNAALELLRHTQPQARQILLDTLQLKQNSPARTAVCRALVTSRTAITQKDDFQKPLLDIIRTSSGLDAQTAAEATLIFDYSEIAEQLKEMTIADAQNRQQKLNAIYAISLRPVNKEAVATIVLLLNEEDKAVADAAKLALPYWIPPGMDAHAILRYLKRKSQSEIIRDWIDFQEKEVRRLQQETIQWQKLYLTAINNEYEAAEDAKKVTLLLLRLQSDQVVVKLWALEKFEKVSGTVVVGDDFTPALLALISDSNRQVRLQTARILAKMSDTNPAAKLLEQLKIEQYEDVQLTIFEALGEACYFAFSPGSSIKLSDDIRTETLTWAEKFIDEDELPPAKAGAEVIRKLLEPNGLKKEQINKHLKLVAERYNRANQEADATLRAELLHIMARICEGIHRDAAAALFNAEFIKGLSDSENASVRLAAVEGLINIDKADALEIFKTKNLFADESASIRFAIIELARQAGNVEDIEWLSLAILGNGEGELAWQAVREILQRQPVKTVVEWIGKLKGILSDDRNRNLLEIAAKKAEAENDPAMSKIVKDALRPMSLQLFLKTADYEKAANLIANFLRQDDLNADSILIKDIQNHLTSPEVNITQKTLLLEKLSAIKIEKTIPRPEWIGQLQLLQQIVKPAPEPKPPVAPKPEPKTETKTQPK